MTFEEYQALGAAMRERHVDEAFRLNKRFSEEATAADMRKAVEAKMAELGAPISPDVRAALAEVDIRAVKSQTEAAFADFKARGWLK